MEVFFLVFLLRGYGGLFCVAQLASGRPVLINKHLPHAHNLRFSSGYFITYLSDFHFYAFSQCIKFY